MNVNTRQRLIVRVSGTTGMMNQDWEWELEISVRSARRFAGGGAKS